MRISNAYDSGFRYGTKTVKDHVYQGHWQGDRLIATIIYMYIYGFMCSFTTSAAGDQRGG
jgi:hypothetical protein